MENPKPAGEKFCKARNIRQHHFVYTSAASYGLFEVRYRKPRGGSRGAMTRSLSGR
jgi:hypothetical protein